MSVSNDSFSFRILYLFKPKPGENHPNHSFYRSLFPKIIQDIESIENNWRMGRHILQRINCRSENSKGVYCLQYDDQKIVSGLRDNTIKVWDRNTLQCTKVSVVVLDLSDEMIAKRICTRNQLCGYLIHFFFVYIL